MTAAQDRGAGSNAVGVDGNEAAVVLKPCPFCGSQPTNSTHSYGVNAGSAGLSWRRPMKTLIAMVIVCLTALFVVTACEPSLAQTPDVCSSSEACLSWTTATRYIDDSPITVPVLNRVYGGLEGQPPRILAETMASQVKLTDLSPGSNCFFIRTVVADRESTNSNISCKTIRSPGPTDGSIEAPTDGSIEPAP